jgi:hypothetical protein
MGQDAGGKRIFGFLHKQFISQLLNGDMISLPKLIASERLSSDCHGYFILKFDILCIYENALF